ncbi:hypothetical protein AOC36_01065 [Erysipelothrix larvae]|uniref:Foldase protein PrsA n=1 Tax=Erysipelothrix larvae TaxID=1514105 RepID=A0A0X8GY91_9FIRM|nr:hypothetical protein [Erysipelothrix larvae]AMC92632.1 hypothetical protein AOC36_01065 [Erysipelothrix larvae]
MKKGILLGLVALVLAGCSSTAHHAVMSEPETLFTYNGTDYTEDFVFQSLITNDTGNILINELEGIAIANMQEKNPIDIEAAVEEQLALIKEELGDNFDTYMTTYYGSVEAYIEQILRPQVYLLEYFGSQLREGDLASVKSEYDMKTLNVYLFSEEADANKVKTILSESKSIETLESQISPEGKTSVIYTNQNTSFVDGMKTQIATLKNAFDVAIYNDTDNEVFYVFVLTDNELSDDTIVDTILQQTDFIDVKMGQLLMSEYNFEVFDARLKEQLKINSPAYVK